MNGTRVVREGEATSEVIRTGTNGSEPASRTCRIESRAWFRAWALLLLAALAGCGPARTGGPARDRETAPPGRPQPGTATVRREPIPGTPVAPPPGGALGNLWRLKSFQAARVSSYDRSGGNADALRGIEPGATATLAEINGPAAIRHIWFTISAEEFYPRKIILRIYWDGESEPSVEAPIGDFFCVGHGMKANLLTLPFAVSSEGRALNCYFPMPFRQSARVTITNEGLEPVRAFYYYIDYHRYRHLSDDAAYFHAQYRQEFPCRPGRNYVILDARGRGHYVGCTLSVEQNQPGWWGEGDDMIYIDGETAPSLHGTGSEDYFCDAWGMRLNDRSLYYGCSVETGFEKGDRATVYRFHIEDPIPFRESIRVTIEHGHANDRSDDYSSVAYWYQVEPHAPFPKVPSVAERLPQEARGDADFPRIAEATKAALADGSRGEEALALIRDFTDRNPRYYRNEDILMGMVRILRATGRDGELPGAFRRIAAIGGRYAPAAEGELAIETGEPLLLRSLESTQPIPKRKRVLSASRGPGQAPDQFRGPAAADFIIVGQTTPARIGTRVQVNFDDGYLYLYAAVEEPEMERLRERHTEHDTAVWEDDAVEFFFDVDRDYTRYHQIIVNPRGTCWDGMGSGDTYNLPDAWNPRVNVWVDRQETRWDIILSIPFGEFGERPPQEGSVWGFNVRRFRMTGDPPEVSTWTFSPKAAPHTPELFGYLVFGEE